MDVDLDQESVSGTRRVLRRAGEGTEKAIGGAITAATTPTFVAGGATTAFVRDPAVYLTDKAAGPAVESHDVMDGVDMRMRCLARSTQRPDDRVDDIEPNPVRSVGLDALADAYREDELSRGRLAAAALPASVATAADIATKPLLAPTLAAGEAFDRITGDFGKPGMVRRAGGSVGRALGLLDDPNGEDEETDDPGGQVEDGGSVEDQDTPDRTVEDWLPTPGNNTPPEEEDAAVTPDGSNTPNGGAEDGLENS